MEKVTVDEASHCKEERKESLDHQAEFFTLVSPIGWQTTFRLVIVGKSANLRFSNFKRALVVKIFVVSTAQVVDDTDCLSHQIHQVFRVGTTNVVLYENRTDSLTENEPSVRDCVLIT